MTEEVVSLLSGVEEVVLLADSVGVGVAVVSAEEFVIPEEDFEGTVVGVALALSLFVFSDVPVTVVAEVSEEEPVAVVVVSDPSLPVSEEEAGVVPSEPEVAVVVPLPVVEGVVVVPSPEVAGVVVELSSDEVSLPPEVVVVVEVVGSEEDVVVVFSL